MLELYTLALLYMGNFAVEQDYVAALDTLFLKDPKNKELLHLESETDIKEAMLYCLSHFAPSDDQKEDFGRCLMDKLRPLYKAQSDLAAFTGALYRIWRDYLERDFGTEYPLYIMSYANDPLTWGDEKQTKELCERMLYYYRPVFRPAQSADAEAVLSLYKSLLGSPFCVWNEAYPGEEEIKHDIETENLYVLEDEGHIIGAVSAVPENELDGFSCWHCKSAHRELARVAVARDRQGMGLAARMVNEAEAILRAQGCQAIHLSVAKGNIPAYKTYLKTGFAVVGEAALYGGQYFLMEKRL